MTDEQRIEALSQLRESCQDAISGAQAYTDPSQAKSVDPWLFQVYEDVITQLKNVREMADRRINLLV